MTNQRCRTSEARNLGAALETGLATLRALDCTLVYYRRQYDLMAQQVDALGRALGDIPDDGLPDAVLDHSVRMALYIEKVWALTGLPKLVEVDLT